LARVYFICLLILVFKFNFVFTQTNLPGFSFSDPNKVLVAFPTFSFPNDACRLGINYVVRTFNVQTNTPGNIVLTVNANQNDPLNLPGNNHPYEACFMMPLGSYQITFKNTSTKNNAEAALILFRHYLPTQSYAYSADPNFLSSPDLLFHRQVIKNKTEVINFTLTDSKTATYQSFINNCNKTSIPASAYCTGDYLVKTVFFSPRKNNQLFIADQINQANPWEIGIAYVELNGTFVEPTSYDLFGQYGGFQVKQSDADKIIYRKIRLRNDVNTNVTLAIRVNGQNQKGQFKVIAANNLTVQDEDITITNYFRWWTESRYQYSHFDKYYDQNTQNDPQAEEIVKYKMNCNKMWVSGKSLKYNPPNGKVTDYCNIDQDPDCKINIKPIGGPPFDCASGQVNKKQFSWAINENINASIIQYSLNDTTWADGSSLLFPTTYNGIVYTRLKNDITKKGVIFVRANACDTALDYSVCNAVSAPLCLTGITENNLNLDTTGKKGKLSGSDGFLASSSVDWLSVAKNDNGDFDISATPNISKTARLGTLKFACWQGDENPDVVLVSQAGLFRPKIIAQKISGFNADTMQITPPQPTLNCNLAITLLGNSKYTIKEDPKMKRIQWIINGNLFGRIFQYSFNNIDWFEGTAFLLKINQEKTVFVRNKSQPKFRGSFLIKSNAANMPAQLINCYGMITGGA
jgi:hypothetical protein